MDTKNVVSMRERKLLLMLAASGNLMSYSDCATRLEMSKEGLYRSLDHDLYRFLADVMKQCSERGLPLFPLLVVRKDTGMPGRGVDKTLEALGIATKAELADPKTRAMLMAAQQERVRQYCRLAANDEKLVARLLIA
jgi:predicted ArsR family transcriptional regulator